MIVIAVICCMMIVADGNQYRLVFKYVCSPNAETEELYNRVVALFRARAAELVKVNIASSPLIAQL